jgi:integrase
MRAKLTKRVVDAVKAGESDTFVWDTEVRGFGLKITTRERKVYILQRRLNGHLRRWTIGVHGSPWTPDAARSEANDLLRAVAHGEDPLEERRATKNAITVAELCDLYLRDGCATKKQSTINVDRGRIERHIKILLGRRRVADLSRPDVERFMVDVATGKSAIDVRTKSRGRSRVTGGKGTATRTVGLLGAVLSFAAARGFRNDNPARGIRRYKDRRIERYLTGDELSRLSGALARAQERGVNPYAIAAIKLLLLTGMRKSEVLTLRRSWIDFERGALRLPDSKTGAKAVPVGTTALDLLRDLPLIVGNPHVFVGQGGGYVKGLQKIWKRVRTDAGLASLRLHDLRHHFISVGASGGESLYILGKVAGHKQAATTQRYAHLGEDPVRAAAERISGAIARSISVPEKTLTGDSSR